MFSSFIRQGYHNALLHRTVSNIPTNEETPYTVLTLTHKHSKNGTSMQNLGSYIRNNLN